MVFPRLLFNLCASRKYMRKEKGSGNILLSTKTTTTFLKRGMRHNTAERRYIIILNIILVLQCIDCLSNLIGLFRVTLHKSNVSACIYKVLCIYKGLCQHVCGRLWRSHKFTSFMHHDYVFLSSKMQDKDDFLSIKEWSRSRRIQRHG